MNLVSALLALLLCSTCTTAYSKEKDEVEKSRTLAKDVAVEGRKKKKKGKKKKKKKGKKKKKKKPKTRPPTASPTKKPTSSNVKVLVKYEDRFGMQTAKSNTNIQVTASDDSWSFLAIDADAAFVNDLKADPFVTMVNPDHEMRVPEENLPTSQGDDLNLLQSEETPWGITRVLQDVAFFNSASVVDAKKVCVADTGYGLGHNDLPSSASDVTGTDATGDFNEAWDEDDGQHGTHCSGTVAARGGNSRGVVGVIPDNKGGKFQLLIGKALSKTGSGSASSVMKAIQGCVDQGANVISLSLGCNNCKTQIEDAFYRDLYKEKDILFVAAAGNSGNNARSYPASYGAVMSVGALTISNARSSFSQFNDQVEISAPGSGIRSTIPGSKYATWDGTSMATPHVAGVAGLLWMHFPTCKNYQIRNVLNKAAKDIDSSGCEQRTGHGLVQAKDAYDLLSAGDCGGNIGTSDPEGGCEQLVVQPTTPPPNPSPVTTPTLAPTPAPVITPAPNPYTWTWNPTGTYYPTQSPEDSEDYDYYEDYYYDYYNDYNDNYEDLVEIEIVIGTDFYPSDTSWKLYNSNGNVVMQGGGYNKRFHEYRVKHDFLRGCYTFELEDNYGDGMCCAWGYGYFDLIYDGYYALFDGGDFQAFTITEIFGDDCY